MTGHDEPADPDEIDPSELDPTTLDRELAATDAVLSSSLRAILAPPEDIEDRVADTVSQQLIGRSVAGTALDLLGLGARALMAILTDGGPPADRYPDRDIAGSPRQDPQSFGSDRRHEGGPAS